MGLNPQVKEVQQGEEDGDDPEFRPDDVVESESDENDHNNEQDDFEHDEGNVLSYFNSLYFILGGDYTEDPNFNLQDYLRFRESCPES